MPGKNECIGHTLDLAGPRMLESRRPARSSQRASARRVGAACVVVVAAIAFLVSMIVRTIAVRSGGGGGGGGDCEKNEEEGGSLGKEAEDVSAVLKVDIPNVDWEEPINKTIETPNTPVLPDLTAVWRRLRKFERCISRIHKIHEMVRRVSEHKEDVIVQELENESRIDISKIFGVL